MQLITNLKDMTEAMAKVDKTRLGFVPTMGALHEGHISLVQRAHNENQTVVVSIFVNPTQFNDKGDLERYPRTLEADAALLEAAGADILFAPSVQDIYPQPDTRQFDFGTLESVMEGATRRGHFNGVAQVVSRLFDIVKPRRAYFGEKDFQQIAIINAMIEMLGYNVEIVRCPIVRAEDGLALSSRNALLSPECRNAAPIIYRAMSEGASRVGEQSVEQVKEFVTEMINNSSVLKVIYFDIVDVRTLQSITNWEDNRHLRACIAVQAGAVRLIDNIEI